MCKYMCISNISQLIPLSIWYRTVNTISKGREPDYDIVEEYQLQTSV